MKRRRDDSEWTLQSLHDHLTVLMHEADRRHEQRSELQDKAVAAALAAAKEAVSKAELASERRFEGVNEFRATLSDQAATFITRSEVEQRFVTNAEKVDDMQSRLRLIEGRSSGLNAGWGYLVAAIGITTTVVSLAFLIQRIVAG
jgi:hypothetical protein